MGFKPLFTAEPTPFQSPDRHAGVFVAGLGARRAPVPSNSTPDEPAQGRQAVDLESELAAAREEGAADARAELQAEIDQLRGELEALSPLIEQVAHTRVEAVGKAAEDIGRIVEGLSRRVLQQHLALDAGALTALVHRALSGFPPEDELVIFAPPDAVEALSAAIPTRTVTADPNLDAGCRIEASYASVEAGLELAMAGVDEAVAAWVASVR